MKPHASSAQVTQIFILFLNKASEFKIEKNYNIAKLLFKNLFHCELSEHILSSERNIFVWEHCWM